MTAREYILKLIRIRKRLILTNRSRQNQAMVTKAMNELQRWLEFYPRANDQQVINFIKRNIHHVMVLIPGKGSPAQASLIEQLNTYIYGNQENAN